MTKNNRQRWGSIYKLTNQVNNKYYFGKTIDFKRRMSKHKCSAKKAKTYIARAIRKHGWQNFNVEIIIKEVPEEDLDMLEKSYIEIFDAMNPRRGYNLTRGGEGTSGYRYTEEQRKRIFTEEERKRRSENSKKYYSKRDQFGTISYFKSRSAYVVRGPSCRNHKNGKYVGQYDTKEEAKNALEIFNKTGQKTVSTRTGRCGCISTEQKKSGKVMYLVYGPSQNHKKGTYVGRYNTKLEAENALKVFNATGKKTSSSCHIGKHGRKIGTGSILVNKHGRFKVNFKKTHIGYYATKEEAEKALNYFTETGLKLKSSISRRKGTVNKTYGKYRAAYKNKHLGLFDSREEAEAAIENCLKQQEASQNN